MDSILKITLAVTFFMGGITYSAIMLLMYALTNAIDLNYVALFGLTLMFTYSIYGFFGLMYVLLVLMASVLCALMYWYDFTFQSLYTVIQSQVSGTFKDMCNQYKQRFTDAITKLGLTDERITTIKKQYQLVNTIADKFIAFVYHYTTLFINLTSDTPGFKQIYNYYGKARLVLQEVYKLPMFLQLINFSLQGMNRNKNQGTNRNKNQGSLVQALPNNSLASASALSDSRPMPIGTNPASVNDMMNNLAQMINMFDNTAANGAANNTNIDPNISDNMMKALFGGAIDAKAMRDRLNDMPEMENIEKEMENLMKQMYSSLPIPK